MESDETVFVPWVPGHPIHKEWMRRLWHNNDDFEIIFTKQTTLTRVDFGSPEEAASFAQTNKASFKEFFNRN